MTDILTVRDEHRHKSVEATSLRLMQLEPHNFELRCWMGVCLGQLVAPLP